MNLKMILPAALLTLTLAACSSTQVPTSTAPASSISAEDQALLQELEANQPEVARTFREALQQSQEAQVQTQGEIQAQSVTSVMESIALGSNSNYNSKYSSRGSYPSYDWNRDGCSAPSWVSAIFGNANSRFRPACNQHDFGYRNYKKFHMANEWNRLKIDSKFYSNMLSICSSNYSWYNPLRYACNKSAETYYNAVRVAGWSHYY
ncbi:phospholipase A2 [Deinococcus roseus]|uniref:Phospholipase n=1 Tax=Deinococcus roseus TaxID=392414 RepID=A0ABQ2CZI6_9DEIO|nr:phospholipase A2 [Deinococcus roseus]GGJ29835.1 hypothetical protein GCM10008938_14860 [Deinococcus roseus]